MKRRLFNAAASVSLLLASAMLVMWVRGHYVSDAIRYIRRAGDGARAVQITSIRCDAGLLVLSNSTRSGGLGVWSHFETHSNARGLIHEVAEPSPYDIGLLPRRQRIGVALSYTEVGQALLIPFWIPVAILLLPGIVVLIQMMRRSMRGKGVCRQCGYDLRATPDRCPECGTVAAAR